eukprot:XP_001698803.1 predicted protein [Chlamydomonas reinhardtii]
MFQSTGRRQRMGVCRGASRDGLKGPRRPRYGTPKPFVDTFSPSRGGGESAFGILEWGGSIALGTVHVVDICPCWYEPKGEPPRAQLAHPMYSEMMLDISFNVTAPGWGYGGSAAACAELLGARPLPPRHRAAAQGTCVRGQDTGIRARMRNRHRLPMMIAQQEDDTYCPGEAYLTSLTPSARGEDGWLQFTLPFDSTFNCGDKKSTRDKISFQRTLAQPRPAPHRAQWRLSWRCLWITGPGAEVHLATVFVRDTNAISASSPDIAMPTIILLKLAIVVESAASGAGVRGGSSTWGGCAQVQQAAQAAAAASALQQRQQWVMMAAQVLREAVALGNARLAKALLHSGLPAPADAATTVLTASGDRSSEELPRQQQHRRPANGSGGVC